MLQKITDLLNEISTLQLKTPEELESFPFKISKQKRSYF